MTAVPYKALDKLRGGQALTVEERRSLLVAGPILYGKIPPFPLTPPLDDFDRPDAPTIGGRWSAYGTSPMPALVDGQAVSDGFGLTALWAVEELADLELHLDIAAIGTEIDVMWRTNLAESAGYYFGVVPPGEYPPGTIPDGGLLVDNLVSTSTWWIPTPVADGMSVGLHAIGAHMELWTKLPGESYSKVWEVDDTGPNPQLAPGIVGFSLNRGSKVASFGAGALSAQ